MIRNASPFRTALLLFSLAASIAPSSARASFQNPAAEQAAAEAVTAFEACEARFDAALASRDVAAADAALRELAAARSRLDAAKPDAGAMNRYRSRYDALQSFKNNAEFARKSLEAALSTAEADAAEGTWPSVQSALRRIDAALNDAQALLKEDELASAAARATKLRDALGAWQASQASREKEVAEAAAIRGEIARADRLLARVAAEQDFDAADRRISEATAAIDGAEARVKSLSAVPVADLRSSIAELRADAKRARDAVAANRAGAAVRARVAKIVREVNALPAGPESQPDMARLDSECDQVRKELEADKRVPAAAAAELSDLLRTSRERIARMRGALDAEAAKRRVADALSAAEQSQGEAGELVRAGRFDDADAALKAAADAAGQMADALKGVPDAAWRDEMGRRGSLLQARLERAAKAVAAARAAAALDDAMAAADADIASMTSDSWAQDRARVAELSQSPDLPPAMRAKAEAMVAKLASFIAYNEAIEKWTRPIDAAIEAGEFESARKQLASLRSALTTPPLAAYHREFLTRLGEDFEARIESGEFWRKVAIAGLAGGAALLLVVGWSLTRRRTDGMASEIRTARQRRDQKVRQLKADRDRSTASDSVRSDAIERISNFDRIESSGFSPMVPGAAPASHEWQDVSTLVNQLAVLGEPDAARALLEAAARHRLIPGTPLLKGLSRALGNVGLKFELFVPGIESASVQLSNGARAVEAAHAWTEIWRASPQAVRDLMAKGADQWFGVAVDWLPSHEDVPALFAQAEFKRDQGNLAGALKHLVGEGDTAEQRIKERPTAVPASLKCKVFLLAANIKLDQAKVVSLRGSGASPAAAWPVVDQYAANRQPYPATGGGPSSESLIADARDLLRRAEQALAAAQVPPPQSSQAPAPGFGGTGLDSPPPMPAADQSLRFQIEAAQFRVELGGVHQQAENALQRVLREPEPTAPGVLVSLSPQYVAEARLADGWSQLQPLMDAGALSPDDCRMVRDMRLNWVNWCIERGNVFGSTDRERPVERETRMRFYRKAAWLACRYWLLAGKSMASEQWLVRSSLVRMANIILAVEERIGVPGGTQRSRALGENGWNPVRDMGGSDDRAVFATLVEMVGAQLPPPTPPQPPVGPTIVGLDAGNGPTIVPPTPRPTLSNVWLVPGAQQRTERVDGKDVPVFNNLRIVDPAMSGADVEGAFAWIDVGSGEPAKAMGVFGFELLEVYKEPLRVVQRPVSELESRGSTIIGSVNQLADLTFDGLSRLVAGFKVVLSWPKPPSVLDGPGSEHTSLPLGQRLCTPIELGKDRIFTPSPDRQPPAPVKEEVIERSLFEIGLFIAAVGVDAKPMPQVVNLGLPPAQYGMGAPVSSEAWMAIVKFFREQLGRGLGGVRDDIGDRVKLAAAAGLVAAQAPFADGILDEQFIRSLVQQLCLRPDEVRYLDAASAWKRMDPALAAALERLVRRFDERNPGILNKESLKKHFNVDLGVVQQQQQQQQQQRNDVGATGPADRVTGPVSDDPRLARFNGLRTRVDQFVAGHWPFATNPELLAKRLDRWIGMLEPVRDSPQATPDRVAAVSALIADIRAFHHELRQRA